MISKLLVVGLGVGATALANEPKARSWLVRYSKAFVKGICDQVRPNNGAEETRQECNKLSKEERDELTQQAYRIMYPKKVQSRVTLPVEELKDTIRMLRAVNTDDANVDKEYIAKANMLSKYLPENQISN